MATTKKPEKRVLSVVDEEFKRSKEPESIEQALNSDAYIDETSVPVKSALSGPLKHARLHTIELKEFELLSEELRLLLNEWSSNPESKQLYASALHIVVPTTETFKDLGVMFLSKQFAYFLEIFNSPPLRRHIWNLQRTTNIVLGVSSAGIWEHTRDFPELTEDRFEVHMGLNPSLVVTWELLFLFLCNSLLAYEEMDCVWNRTPPQQRETFFTLLWEPYGSVKGAISEACMLVDHFCAVQLFLANQERHNWFKLHLQNDQFRRISSYYDDYKGTKYQREFFLWVQQPYKNQRSGLAPRFNMSASALMTYRTLDELQKQAAERYEELQMARSKKKESASSKQASRTAVSAVPMDTSASTEKPKKKSTQPATSTTVLTQASAPSATAVGAAVSVGPLAVGTGVVVATPAVSTVPPK